MEIKKKVVRVGGDTLGIRFAKRELEIFGIREGDEIDIADMIIEEGVRRKK